MIIGMKINKSCWTFTATSCHFIWKLQLTVCKGTFCINIGRVRFFQRVMLNIWLQFRGSALMNGLLETATSRQLAPRTLEVEFSTMNLRSGLNMMPCLGLAQQAHPLSFQSPLRSCILPFCQAQWSVLRIRAILRTHRGKCRESTWIINHPKSMSPWAASALRSAFTLHNTTSS